MGKEREIMIYVLVRNRGYTEFESLDELMAYAKIAYLKYPDSEITIRTKKGKVNERND
jgi:hypothetical protein